MNEKKERHPFLSESDTGRAYVSVWPSHVRVYAGTRICVTHHGRRGAVRIPVPSEDGEGGGSRVTLRPAAPFKFASHVHYCL